MSAICYQNPTKFFGILLECLFLHFALYPIPSNIQAFKRIELFFFVLQNFSHVRSAIIKDVVCFEKTPLIILATDYGLQPKTKSQTQIKKSFKMYENLSFLQKRWLSITKSQNRGTQKYPKIPRNLFGQSAQSAKLFGMFKKNLSWGVCSP